VVNNCIETRKCNRCGLEIEFEVLKQPPFIPESSGSSDEFELYFDSQKGTLKDLISLRKNFVSLSSVSVGELKHRFNNHEKILLGVFLDGFIQDELYELEKQGLVDELLTIPSVK